MSKHREKSPAGTIAISAIATSIVLGALTYLLVFHGLPLLRITTDMMYSVLLRLLPIIVGLILVLISLAIRPPHIPKDTDREDELEKDVYTAPLYVLPDEEAKITVVPLPTASETVAEPAAPTEAPSPRRLEDIVPHITPFERKALQEEAVPKEWEPPRYFAPSVATETYEPIPQTEPVETTMASDMGLGRAVLFEEYPYPIAVGSEIAELLEPIEETLEDGGLSQQEMAVVEDEFEARLNSELESADDLGYELSLAIIDLPKTDRDLHSVDATIVQNLFNRLGLVSFFYLTEEHRVSAILPFHGFEQCKRYFATLLENLRKQHPDTAIQIGYSSTKRREVGMEELIHEATVAVEMAAERSGFSLIGYDSDLEQEED